jgi:hypothetical protein
VDKLENKRDELLIRVADNYGRLRDYRENRMRCDGLGALVFLNQEAEISESRIDCEYWTMGKIRDCLRQLDEYDERVYRWLREADDIDALPVVVFSPGEHPGTLDLTFHKMMQNATN